MKLLIWGIGVASNWVVKEIILAKVAKQGIDLAAGLEGGTAEQGHLIGIDANDAVFSNKGVIQLVGEQHGLKAKIVGVAN